MFASILYTIFGAVNSITYKRACNWAERFGYADIVMTWTNQLVEWPWYIIASLILPNTIAFQWSSNLYSAEIIIAFIGLACSDFITNLLDQYAYANEKVSVLQPYSELGAILMIFASLAFPFLHKSASPLLIGGAVSIAVILVVANINFKAFTFNKYCFAYILHQIGSTIEACITIWLLTKFTSVTIMTISGITLLLFATVNLFFKKNKIPVANKNWWQLAKLTFINDGMWAISTIAFYFIVSSSNIIFATLLGMLQFAITLILAYIVFKDKPSKKDLLLGTFVIVAVSFLGLNT